MKFRYWLLLVFLLIFFVTFGSCTYVFLGGLRTDTYHGRVVDEETGGPLAGTAVTVIWSKAPLVSLEGGPKFFHNAQETLTDSDGKFSLQVSPGLDWDPTTTRVDDPWIVIYQPMYKPLMLDTLGQMGFETTDALVTSLKKGVTIKLLKLRKDETRKYTDHGVVTLNLPLNRIPKLMRAVNEQRRLAGFDPLTIESSEKGKTQ